MPHANPEQARAYDRAYRAAHRDERNAKKRAWYANNRARVAAYRRKRETLIPEMDYLNAAQRRARRYGVPCTLTLADVRALLAPMRCSATGLPLAHAKGKADALSPSIDRIEVARGYVPGNVRLVCFRFNIVRGSDPVSHDFRHALRVLAETSHPSDRGVIDHETTRRAAA